MKALGGFYNCKKNKTKNLEVSYKTVSDYTDCNSKDLPLLQFTEHQTYLPEQPHIFRL